MFSTQLPSFFLDNPDFLQGRADLESTLEKSLEGPKIRAVLDSVLPQGDLPAILQQGQQWAQRFKTFVIFGTGGSSLGAQTLCALKQFGFSQPACRVLFMDNIDPATFKALFETIKLQETGFLIVSKSGTTAETLCQLLTLLPQYSPAERSEHLFVLTEPKPSPLRDLARQHQLKTFDHSLDIGGRFSVFTNVGLLPAAVAGVDIEKIREGARWVLENPHSALEGAALALAALNEGYTQTVTMPYCDQLFYYTFWFRQLWAESVGKDGKGTTPLNALGTVDQHSQLQLYLDGPRDKLFTVIVSETFAASPLLDSPDTVNDLAYFNGKSMADLMKAEQRATIDTLRHKGCPVRVITLNSVTEASLGALLMHSILETIFAAQLMAVDAFNQPAVEDGKRLTRLYLAE